MTSFNTYIKKVSEGLVLKQEEMAEAMAAIMDGSVQDDAIEAFLTGLRDRGEQSAEITGAARILREKALTINAPDGALDCCGTGGDARGTFNISTAVALVSAACGVPVAKHGNRASSSKSGTMDVLEQLGVHFDAHTDLLEKALRDINFCFLPAQKHHSALKAVMPVRQKIGTRTIFNLLGPLANPAGTQFQLIGVYDGRWLVPFAETLRNLGSKRAWIVHGHDGLDEITLTGATDCAILNNGQITTRTLSPDDFGLPVCRLEDLKGGDAKTNAAALRALLDGEPSAYRNIVLANSAAALAIHNDGGDLRDHVARAAKAIDSGAAKNVLQNYIDYIHKDGS